MAFTKVTGPGIHTETNILSHNINSSGIITATEFSGPLVGNANNTSGISTFYDLRVSNNLTVEGATTTLDTNLIGVDRVEVGANSNTVVGVAITQSGTADILRLYDNTTQAVTVQDGGRVLIGTTTEGHSNADDLTIATAAGSLGNTGITIRSSTTGDGNIFFSDATSGDGETKGVIKYTHDGDYFRFNTAGGERLHILSGGGVGIGDSIYHLGDDNTQIRFPAADTVSVETAGQQNVQVNGARVLLKSPSGTDTTVRLQHQGNSGYGDIILDRTVNAFIIDNDPSNASTNQSYFSVKNKGTENLRILHNGRVGIASAVPTAPLNVQAETSTGVCLRLNQEPTDKKAYIQFQDYATTGADSYILNEGYDLTVYAGYGGKLNLGAYATTGITVRSTGKVGVGTDNPLTKFVVSNDGAEGLEVSHASGVVEVNAYKRSDSSRSPLEITAQTFKLSTGNPSLTAGLHQDTSGHVIIGNASYGAAGSFSIASHGSFRQVLASGASQDSLIGAISGVSNGFQINTDGSNNITYRFHNGSTESFRIHSDGKVGIGSAIPAEKLDVAGHLKLATVQGTNTNANLPVLYQHNDNVIHGGSTLNWNPAEDTLKVNGSLLSANSLYGATGTLKLAAANHSSTSYVEVTDKVEIAGQIVASQDYPNFRPTLDFNFAAVKKLDPRITYQRSGPASYVDEFGKVVLVGANTPRFDHDPATGESKGLLIEESITNLIPNSFDKGTWSAGSAGTLTRNAGIAPDGTNTATKASTTSNDIDVGPQLGNASAGATGQIAISGGTTYTLSVWVKASTASQVGNNFKLRWKRVQGDSTFSENTFALPANWTRHSTTATTAANNSTIACYVGGVSGSEALVWGAQLEATAYSTSLIPTYGTTATRGVDTAFIDGQDFTDAYNVPEGTFVLKQSVDDTSTSNQWGWGVEKSGNRGGFFNGLGFRVGGGGAGYVGAWYNNNGSTSAFHNMNVGATVNIPFVSAFAYKVNDMAATSNGITVATDTSASIANAGEFDRFTLGTYHYDTMSTGHIQRVMYYRKRLPSSQLITLTS